MPCITASSPATLLCRLARRRTDRARRRPPHNPKLLAHRNTTAVAAARTPLYHSRIASPRAADEPTSGKCKDGLRYIWMSTFASPAILSASRRSAALGGGLLRQGRQLRAPQLHENRPGASRARS